MNKRTTVVAGITLLVGACEQPAPPPPKVDVNIAIEEEKEERKPLMPKGERSTVQGNGQRFTRP